MKSKILLAIFGILLCLGLMNAQKTLQEPSGNLAVPPTPIQIDETRKNEVITDDPFAKRTSPENGKRHHPRNNREGFPDRADADQTWQTYKPFVYDDDEKGEEEKRSNRVNSKEFNEILKWGMLAGTAFLAFVLIKTCAKKRGRRELRRVMEENLRRRQNLTQPVANLYFYQPQQQPFNTVPKELQDNLDDKILNAEMELERLKELKQQKMRQEFNKKKMEEEQRKIEMVNVQRKQPFQQQPKQNNWNVGYGPVFYGQENMTYAQNQPQQPFHIQGIEPIRQRSNSFKTEISEQPILNNQIKYRNGIPIGKPVRQHDNDSSFASEYPDV